RYSRGEEIVRGLKGFDCPMCGGGRTLRIKIKKDVVKAVCSKCGFSKDLPKKGPAFTEVNYYAMLIDLLSV
ncbi:MAG: hypothetical protein QXD57_07430, partial [Ignisphaera sp.]